MPKNNFFKWLIDFLKFLSVFVLFFVISFIIVNFPALKIRYGYNVKTKNHQAFVDPQKYPPLATQPNYLVIPKIGVVAPISWNVMESGIDTALKKGIAHYKKTALPDEIGNTFIFGHSSYYWWAEGSYKQVFALLDKVEKGDRIYVNYKKTIYAYVVTDKVVVGPDDVSVMAQSNQKILSLMTCVPVGTNLKRLVVKAVPVAL